MAEKLTNTMFAILHSAASDIPVFVDPAMPAVKKVVARGLARFSKDDLRLVITPAGRAALEPRDER